MLNHMKAKEGLWWIINAAPDDLITVFWCGDVCLAPGGQVKFIYTFRPELAAQFDSQQSAIFQANILGIDVINWRAEQHRWV